MNHVTNQVFRLPDRIGFANAAAVRRDGERFLDEAQGPAEISLAALRENNSMVVALLLAWVRHARARGKAVGFIAIPPDLRNIIDLYGVADVLPLEVGGPGSAWSVADEDDPAARPGTGQDRGNA